MRAGDPQQIYARPLIPLLLALMAGIVLGLWLPGLSSVLVAVATVFLILLLILLKKQRVYLVPLFLFLTLGYWSLQSWTSPRLPENHISRFIDNKPWHMIGRLDGDPEQFPDRTRFILEVESLARRGVFYHVCGAVRVTIREHISALRSGDQVACLAKLKEIRNFNNPGGFDYRRYLAFRGIWASASVSTGSFVIRLHPAETGLFRRAAGRTRQAVSGLIQRAISTPTQTLPLQAGPGTTRAKQAGAIESQVWARGGGHGGGNEEVRGIIKALLIGDRSEVSQEIRDVFNRIGIGHLLAISGLHIGMVATLAFLSLRFVLARSQRILLAAWPTKGAALLSLFPVLFYGFLAGMSPATQRAVIMVSAFLVALVFEQEQDTINTLTLAALVILIISPTALFEISFQLSFTAVFAILYLIEHLPFVIELRRGTSRVYKRLALFLSVSAAAILGTLPVVLYYFNQTSLIGLLTNCLMVPLVGFMVVPIGLLGVLFLPIAPTGALWIMKAAAGIMQGGVALVVLFSWCPFAAIRNVTPTFVEIGLYYALAWALLNFRQTRLAKAGLIGIALVASADVAYWAEQRFGRQELRVTMIDVGQGSSTLLELPEGPCVLVDGGGFYDNRFDVGARVVGPFLWKKKIATVETVVLSHPHPDHLNGLLFIVRHFDVREVWMNQEHADTELYRDFLKIVSEKNIRVVGLKDLVKPRMINGVGFQVLYPPLDFMERKARDGWRTRNNNSLVLKVSFQNISFILPGDIEADAENELTSLACTTLKSNVLLVPHHGSQNSSTHEFLRCIRPDIAVISSGWKNTFGFPHQKTLKRYQAHQCQIFRTDHQGAITITTDGTHLTVKPFL